MRLDEPLDDALQSRSYVRVLRTLFRLPEGLSVSGREVARRSSISHPTATSVLESLAIQGVVLVHRSLRLDQYELNRHHALVEKLTPLFEWERQVRDQVVASLRSQLERAAPWISAAFLFGSAVRGEMTLDSDVDLAVVVSESRRVAETELALQEIADVVRQRFGVRLEGIVGLGTVEYLMSSRRRGHRLWRNVVREGIVLFLSTASEREVVASRQFSA